MMSAQREKSRCRICKPAWISISLTRTPLSNCFRSALDANVVRASHTRKHRLQIKNVNYQRSVEAAITTAMEITASLDPMQPVWAIRLEPDFSRRLQTQLRAATTTRIRIRALMKTTSCRVRRAPLAGWFRPTDRPVGRILNRPRHHCQSGNTRCDQSGMLFARC